MQDFLGWLPTEKLNGRNQLKDGCFSKRKMHDMLQNICHMKTVYVHFVNYVYLYTFHSIYLILKRTSDNIINETFIHMFVKTGFLS